MIAAFYAHVNAAEAARGADGVPDVGEGTVYERIHGGAAGSSA